jgi:iron(III) transport system substrate-binding protein
MQTNLLKISKLFFGLCLVMAPSLGLAQGAKPGGQAEWEQTIAAAKKEGKVVISIPSSSELRTAIEARFEKRFGIDVEAVSGRASSIVRRMVEEYKAGVHYFDLHIGGSQSILTGLLPEGVLDPVEPAMILPEVKDPKEWWGGHIWADNAKRYIYTTLAYQSESLWYNSQLMKPDEMKSFDDLLDKKFYGKLGLLDPRTPGAGASIWSYLREIKGDEFMRKLVAQKMLIGRDQRVLAESLAKGRIMLGMGLTYYSYAPFVKAGLPIAPLPIPREGIFVSGGSGNLAIFKNAPHPNALHVFVNWLLGKEGQELYSKALGQGTRRLDVDTKWLRKFGVIAAKDNLTLDDYMKLENQSEDRIRKIREPGAALARKLLGH